MIETAVEEAKNECVVFLGLQHVPGTTQEVVAALGPVLKALKKVIVTSHFLTGRKGEDRRGVVVYEAEGVEPQNDAFKLMRKLVFTPEGSLVMEDVLTCQNECHVYAVHAREVELEVVLQEGVTPRQLVETIKEFLCDPDEAVMGPTLGMIH